jgi:threonine/homoserine/homoserine lactone efflux protein
MAVETWLAFVAAAAMLVLIPGPTVLLVLSYGLGQGWRAAFPLAVGVALGDFTAMTLSLLGVGALLSASATLFTVVKWIGAAYLIYLGLRLFNSGGAVRASARQDSSSPSKMLMHAWLVTSLNPKGILFFVAFFPQFIDIHQPIAPQVVILGSTFLVIAFANALGYAFFATRARRFVGSEQAIRMVNRTGGVVLMAAGLATMALRRAT